MQRPAPHYLLSRRIHAQHLVAHGAEQLSVIDERFRSLVSPDAVYASLSDVGHRQRHLCIALRRAAESNHGIQRLAVRLHSRRRRSLGVIEIVRLALRRFQCLGSAVWYGGDHRHHFILLLSSFAVSRYLGGFAFAEVALTLPHCRR